MTTSNVLKAAGILRNDGVVAIPTETVYGLAARIGSPIALEKIFTVKERPFFDPLIIHISKFDQLEQISPQFNHPLVKKLADAFWPGPISIILKKHPQINSMITSGLETVAVRMPNHPVTLDLINVINEPVAAPSANKFGKTSPTCAEHVRQSFKNDSLFILEGEESSVGIESTVIRLNLEEDEKKIEILRPGFISKDQILAVIGESYNISYQSSFASPGNIKHHYMPDIPLYLINDISDQLITTFELELKKKDLIIHALQLEQNEVIAARQLYSKLREASLSRSDLIVFSVKNRKGELWNAILDRLKRAATFDYSSK